MPPGDVRKQEVQGQLLVFQDTSNNSLYILIILPHAQHCLGIIFLCHWYSHRRCKQVAHEKSHKCVLYRARVNDVYACQYFPNSVHILNHVGVKG